jgi:hypothetical protein
MWQYVQEEWILLFRVVVLLKLLLSYAVIITAKLGKSPVPQRGIADYFINGKVIFKTEW